MAEDVTLDVIGRFDRIEKQIRTVFGKPFYIQVAPDPTSLLRTRKILQTTLDSTPIRLTNISVAGGLARGIRKSLQTELDRAPLYVNRISLGRGAAAQLRKEVQDSLRGIVLPRFGGTTGSGGRGRGGGAGGLPLGRIGGDATEFRKSLDAANARVLAFGASAGAIYLVARAFRELVSSTVEVDKSLREINVLLGLTDSNLNKFGAEVFTIAKNTATGFKVAADAALEFSRQGLSVEETLARTAAALNLTRLSGLDSVKAVDALTTALNSFNKEGLTAAEVADKLAAVDAVAATSAGGLAEGVSRVGSAASDAGVSFDELLGLIASAKQITGRSESVIGNAFKTIFTRLDRSKVRDVLGGVVDIGENESAIQILQKLAGAYDGLSRQQQAYIAEITAGVFQINQFKAIVSDLGAEFSVFDISQRAAADSTGIADKRVKELTQSLSDLAQITGTNIQQAFAKIGDVAFSDTASDVLKAINTIFDQLNSIDSESAGAQLGKDFITGITNFLTGPGLALIGVIGAKLVSNLGGYGKSNVKEFLGTEKALQNQLKLQDQLGAKLQQQSRLNKAVLSGRISIEKASSVLIKRIERENIAYQKQLDINRQIAAISGRRGVGIGVNDRFTTSADKKPSRLSKFGKGLRDPFNLAIGASIVGEAAGNLFNQDTKGGRGGAAIASGIGSAASFGLLGGLAGPGGAVLGASLGALAAVPEIITAFSSDLPEIQKRLDSATTDFSTFSSLSQTVLSLQSNYDGLITDVASGSATQAALNKAQVKLTTEIAKLPANIRKQYQDLGEGLSPEKAFEQRSSLLNQEVSRRQGLAAGQSNNLQLSSILDQNQISEFRGNIIEGFYSAVNKFPNVAILRKLEGGSLFGATENAQDITRGLGFQVNESDYNDEQDSRLRELASNIVNTSNLTEDGFLKLAKNAGSVSEILNNLGQSADSDLGRLLNRLQKDSPNAFDTFVLALRSGSVDMAKTLKEVTAAQQNETDVSVKAAKTLKTLQNDFDLLSNSIKNANDLFDLIASNQIKNRGADREFATSLISSRGNQASQLGNERAGANLGLSAELQSNIDGSLNAQSQLLQETFQNARNLFENGVKSIFAANPNNKDSKTAIAEEKDLTAEIGKIFSSGGDISKKISEAKTVLSKTATIAGNADKAAKQNFNTLNQNVDALVKQSNEKLTQNQRELQQINKKLALDTLNANIERLIRAAEGAFGGISNFTDPANNQLFTQLQNSIEQITGSDNFADQQRGRFGALQSLTGIAGQPFLSDTNQDVAQAIRAYTTQLEDQFSSLVRERDVSGQGSLRGVVSDQTINEFKDAIKSLGGFENIAQTQILKSLGVSQGSLFNQQIGKFQNNAIQNVPDRLLDALIRGKPLAENETTVAIISQTQILSGKIDETNRLLGGKTSLTNNAAQNVNSAVASGVVAASNTDDITKNGSPTITEVSVGDYIARKGEGKSFNKKQFYLSDKEYQKLRDDGFLNDINGETFESNQQLREGRGGYRSMYDSNNLKGDKFDQNRDEWIREVVLEKKRMVEGSSKDESYLFTKDGSNALNEAYRSLMKNPNSQINPGLSGGPGNVISRQSADTFDPNIIAAKVQAKQIQLLNNPGYQKSLLGIQGGEQAFKTIREGGGSPDVDLFKKIFDKLGINPNDVNKPTQKQQQALDVVNQNANATIEAQAVTLSAPVFNVPADAQFNFAGNGSTANATTAQPATALPPVINATVNIDAGSQVTQEDVEIAINQLRQEIYKQIGVKIPPVARPK